MRRATIVLLAAVLPGGWSTASAQDFTSTHTDCGGLQLYGAAGVPDGAVHKYQFRGICRELELNDDNDVLQVRWEGWVEIDSRYDVKTAEFDEGVKVAMSGQSDGPPSGTINLRLKCTQDPLLPPAGSCTIMQSSTTTTWPDFVTAWTKGKPFTKGKVTSAQAVALSQQASKAPPPPPPPPPPKSKPARRGVVPGAAPAAAPARTAKAATTPAPTELTLAANAKIMLQSGRALAAQPLEGSLRWTVLGEGGEVLRTFPQGSRAYRNSKGEILVDWGSGTFNAGPVRPDRRLRLPP